MSLLGIWLTTSPSVSIKIVIYAQEQACNMYTQQICEYQMASASAPWNTVWEMLFQRKERKSPVQLVRKLSFNERDEKYSKNISLKITSYKKNYGHLWICKNLKCFYIEGERKDGSIMAWRGWKNKGRLQDVVRKQIVVQFSGVLNCGWLSSLSPKAYGRTQ